MMGPMTSVLASIALAISGAGATVGASHSAIRVCELHRGDVSHCTTSWVHKRSFRATLKPHSQISWRGRCYISHWRVSLYGQRLIGHFLTDVYVFGDGVSFNGMDFENEGPDPVKLRASC